MRALVSLQGVRGRVTQEDWDEAVRRNEIIIAKAESQGGASMAESLHRQLAGIPKRAKAWIRASTYWDRLCKGGLSHERLETWYRRVDIRKA